jgi:hypothetical protein
MRLPAFPAMLALIRLHPNSSTKIADTFAFQLANTEEWQDGQSNGALGEVFIRYVASSDVC